MYLQMHLLSVMLHGGPVRFGKKWSGPPKIEIIFIGINPISVHEILVENKKRVLRPHKGTLLLASRDRPSYKPYWGLTTP